MTNDKVNLDDMENNNKVYTRDAKLTSILGVLVGIGPIGWLLLKIYDGVTVDFQTIVLSVIGVIVVIYSIISYKKV